MAYKAIMLDLGLELSPSKGLESPKGVFEFCKRLITPIHEFSPIGMKGMSVALKSPAYLTSLFVDLMGKGYKFTNDTLEQLFTRPPKFIIKHRKMRDNVLWTLLGVFGFLNDGAQIGPDKKLILDSSVSTKAYRNLLTLLNATSRSIAKRDIGTSMKESYAFLEKLKDSYSLDAVQHFRASVIPSSFQPFIKYLPNKLIDSMNAVSKFMAGTVLLSNIS